HVTVADGIDPEVIAAAPHVLGAYRRDVTVTAVRLLEERDRRWMPIGAYPLGPPATIGRGGLPVEIETLVDDDDVVLTAYRAGQAGGRAAGWRRGSTAWLTALEVDEAHRRDRIASHLFAAFESWAAAAGTARVDVSSELAIGPGGAEFLAWRGR
nr:hypothetical protein [Actinomycetota bacterium]